MRVLVIEDDEELAETVAAGLREARMAVDVALDGDAGLARAFVHDYDVIVLDRDLRSSTAMRCAPGLSLPAVVAGC